MGRWHGTSSTRAKSRHSGINEGARRRIGPPYFRSSTQILVFVSLSRTRSHDSSFHLADSKSSLGQAQSQRQTISFGEGADFTFRHQAALENSGQPLESKLIELLCEVFFAHFELYSIVYNSSSLLTPIFKRGSPRLSYGMGYSTREDRKLGSHSEPSGSE